MSRAIRTPEETYDLALTMLERRVQALERSGAGLVSIMQLASAPLVLTGVFQDVAGTAIAITRPGRYIALVNGDLSISVASASNLARITINAVGAATARVVDGFYEMDSVRPFLTRMAFGAFTFAGAGTLTMQGRLSAGTATINSVNAATGILVVRTGAA